MRPLLILPVLFIIIGFSADARAQWTPLGTTVCEADSFQSEGSACPDGAGGIVIAWLDARETYLPSPAGGQRYDIYAQRLDAAGIPQWTANGVLVCAESAGRRSYPRLVADGTGGAIITWYDLRTSDRDIYVQRLDGNGVVQWTANGVAITTGPFDQTDPRITTDGAGGAIVVWKDGNSSSAQFVVAQRVNGAGIAQWQIGGVVLSNWASPSQPPSPDIASDGVGGAFVTWEGPTGVPQNYTDILVQRVAGNGTLVWALPVTACAAFYYQWRPVIIPSGTGAIVAWEDERDWPKRDIYAQRLDGSGAAQWPLDGVPVCTAAAQKYRPVIATDGADGAIIVWDDYRLSAFNNTDIYAQRITSSGVAQWTANGEAIADASYDQRGPRLVADGSGGAIIAWTDDRGPYNRRVLAQRIQSTGTAQWADDGIYVDMDPENQYIPVQPLLSLAAPAIVSDLAGGAILAYTQRSGNSADINAQHISSDGSLPTGVGNAPPLSIALSDNYPNPFSAGTSFELTLERESHVRVDVFDASGRRVRTHDMGRVQAGPSRLTFDAADDRAGLLPSGVYFYRVTANGTAVTHKMVIVK